MAEFPAMPLWTDAYLGDTTHLSTIEHGAYLLLLITAWRSKTHDLPDDDKLLSRYARLTVGQWLRIRPTIEAYWQIEGGRWSNDRLLDEVESVRRLTQQRSDAGKASALKRLHRDRTGVQRKRNEKTAPTPTPTPTPKKESESSPPEGWEAFKTAFPRKYDLEEAMKQYRKVVESGVLPTLLLSQAEAYARDCAKRKTAIEYIVSPYRWLLKKRWTDEYEPPELTAAERERVLADEFLPQWAKGRRTWWPDEMLGPAPGQPGCRVPADLLAKHGLLPPLAVVAN